MIKLVEGLLRLIYPPRCLGCRKLSNGSICVECDRQLLPMGDRVCERCGSPEVGNDEVTCRLCQVHAPLLTRARSGFLYRGVIKKLVHQFKYRRKAALGEHLSEKLWVATADWLNTLGRIDLVVPVPTTSPTRRQRGYNQTEIMAQNIARHLGVPYAPHVLSRVSRQGRQHQFNREERFRVLQGAFQVSARSGPLTPHVRILLIDDLYTTGATANACCEALQKSKLTIDKIYVLTLCRVSNLI